MASRDKRGAAGPPSAGRTPRQEVDRLIAKGWFKDAIKQAKLLHRAEPTAEHHRLLEQAYFLRARELRDGGMANAAQEVAMHLLDFGITDPELTEPAAALMMAVGLGRQALELQKKLDSPDALDRLTRQAADQAVLRPDRASAAPPEIRDGAARVRSVLESLTKATADDATAALDGLRDVSRNSPFADWRLFARGLVAFRRRDDVEARANWDRLDPDRAASRIARGLSAATDSTLRDGKPSPKVEALERRAFGEPILGPLRELGDLAAQGLWPEAIRRLAAVRLALRRLDPRLAVRLTEALYPLVLNEATGLGYQAGQNLLKAFTKAAEPLPVDARWNRLWALAWESPQGHPEEARPFWKRYLDDLDASPAIRADERPIAKAIVLAHEGREWLNLALDLEDEEPRRVVDEEATDARRTAVSLLQESLKLFPSRRETYRTLMEVYETSDQPEKAAEVAGRVLEALPEDFEALDFLGQHHYRRGEPDRALEYAIRARKLKPLDRDVLMNEVGSRVALSRRLALEGRYDEARAELAITAELNPESVGRPLSAARRACLEIKAGATEAAKAIIDEALGQLPEPAPLWLAMAIEARRIKLPQAEIDHREGLWRKAVAGKVRGETAGELAGIAVPFQAKGISYPGCEEHTEQVMDYIRRTTRIKYNRREDLANACSFVSMVPGNTDLVEKLARKGLKLFPEAPEFPMMLGVMGMVKGPLEGNLWETQKFFKSALKLAEAEGANSPQAVERISKIKEALTAIDSILGGPMGFPFLGGPKGKSSGTMMDAFRAMMEAERDGGFDLDDDDDYDDFDGPGPAPTPLPPPRPKKPKKKR